MIRKIAFILFFFFCFGIIFNTASACQSECGSSLDCNDTLCTDCVSCQQIKGRGLGILFGIGPLGNPTITRQDPGTSTFSKFISTVIGVMTIVAFIWFIFTLMSGAIAWLSSGGDKQKLQNAQKQITTGLTGLIIVISAIFLIKIVGTIFGIDILNIQEAIINLQ